MKTVTKKPINTVNKGRAIELKAKKKLIAEGYLVDKKIRSRFASPDFYGLFDLLAIKEDHMRLVQVKSNPTDFYKARKYIIEWKTFNNITHNTEIWLYKGRKDKIDLWRIEAL